jgi:hypothetical protein
MLIKTLKAKTLLLKEQIGIRKNINSIVLQKISKYV